MDTGIVPGMADDVNTRRGYDSSGRQTQARQRRRAALDSALALITSLGYAAMTMPKIGNASPVTGVTVLPPLLFRPTSIGASLK